MEEEEDTTPFWLENGGGNRRRLRRSYSLFLSSSTIVIVLVVIALAFTLIIVPTLQSFISHVLKPQSVKKSWDFLNLVLVLFAIFCGFLSRNNDNNQDETPQQEEKPNIEIETVTQPPWYEYSNRTTRLRSFKSYPDLRQESSWIVDDERWRFNDDTHVNGYREVHEKEEADNGIKNVEVDTFIARRNTYQDEEKKIKKASATKELFTSMKEKKKKKSSILNSEFEPSSSRALPPPPPPPPLPPPPPSSVFDSPPPPPPPFAVFDNVFYSKKSKHKKHKSVSPPQHNVSSYTKQPRLSKKGEDFFGLLYENMNSGNESALNTIPPPPPPPPFNLPAWKFKVQGDYVRINSISSSSSEEMVDTNNETGTSEESGILLVYPKVDFDDKVDTFVETFKAGVSRRKR